MEMVQMRVVLMENGTDERSNYGNDTGERSS